MANLSALEQQFGLPSGLLSAVQQQESGGDPNAVSPAGALGAFQFMPATAKQYGIDPLDPDQAAVGAAKMYSDLLDKYDGDVPSALAAYNWGQGNLDKNGLPNAPAETKNYVASIMGKLDGNNQASKVPSTTQSILSAVGNAILPSANAAEMPQYADMTPQQQVAQDVAKEPAQNPYDSMSDEQLTAEAQKYGLISSGQTGQNTANAKSWADLPPDQQVTSAPLDSQKAQISPYDTMTDSQLAAEAQKYGIKAKLPTGTAAYGGELAKSFTGAGDMAASGFQDFTRAFSPLTALARMASGGQPTPEEADYLNQGTKAGFLSPVADIAKGLGKGALGALGALFSPVDAANASFAGNPLQNATGIPAGLTDFALGLVEPWGAGKAISKFAPVIDAALGDSALAQFGQAAPEADSSALAQVAQPAETAGGQAYNVFNDQGRQATANDTIADFAGKDVAAPQPPPPPINPAAAGAEVAGSTVPTSSTQAPNIPMSAGQATQNPTLQRFEADALAGAKGEQAQSQALAFNAKQQAAVGDMLQNIGNYKEGGNPADSVGTIAKFIRANENVADQGVNQAYKQAYALSDGLNLTRGDMNKNLVPQIQQFAKDFRIKEATTPKAFDAMQDLTDLAQSNKGMPSLEETETWRRSVTNLASKTTDPADATALRGLVNRYDSYMGDLADRLGQSAVTATSGNAKQAAAINAFKDAVASRREYGSMFEGNDIVENIVNSNKSVDDITQDLLGTTVGSKQGMLENVNAILRASGDNSSVVKAQLQNAYAQKIYDSVAGSKIAGTNIDSLSLPKLQTALENTFIKNREFATALYGNDAVNNAQEAIKALDLINSKQANVGNPSSSGYTIARLTGNQVGGLLSHIPFMGKIIDGLSGLAHLGEQARQGKDAAQAFSGVTPKSYIPVSPNPIPSGSGIGLATTSAINRSQ